MKFEKFGKQLDKKVSEAEVEVDKTTKEFKGLSKTSKYVIYGLIGLIVLGFGSCALRGCSKSTPTQTVQSQGYVQQSQPVQPQPVVVQQGSNTADMVMAGALGYVIGQTMSNGQTFNGHNAPTKVVNNHVYYVSSDGKSVDKSVVDKKVTETPKTVTPVVNQKSVDQKNVKAEADKAAEAEKAKMKLEAEQKSKQEKLKADLKAKQTQRTTVSTPSKPSGGFKSFSKGRR